jgi:hypothetical protein
MRLSPRLFHPVGFSGGRNSLHVCMARGLSMTDANRDPRACLRHFFARYSILSSSLCYLSHVHYSDFASAYGGALFFLYLYSDIPSFLNYLFASITPFDISNLPTVQKWNRYGDNPSLRAMRFVHALLAVQFRRWHVWCLMAGRNLTLPTVLPRQPILPTEKLSERSANDAPTRLDFIVAPQPDIFCYSLAPSFPPTYSQQMISISSRIPEELTLSCASRGVLFYNEFFDI